MHDAVADWCLRWAHQATVAAVDVGGRDVNGSVRHMWPNATWFVIDAQDGPGVDEVANGTTWRPAEQVELVLCTEVFEHTPLWPAIVANVATWLSPGGMFVTTMAGPGRERHRIGHDDADSPGWYANVTRPELEAVLREHFADLVVEQYRDDVRGVAWVD